MTQPTEPRERTIRKGEVALSLDDINNTRTRANMKAAAFPSRVSNIRQFQYEGIRIRIISVESEEIADGSIVLKVELEDMPEGANPFIFVNPPLLVSRGIEDEKEIFEEDIPEAFRQMVGETVKTVLERVQ